jgi:predicted nucleic acid-binding protein
MKPRNRYLLDAGIFSLILAGDSNVKRFVEEIASGRAEPLACEVNLAEFYAKTCEKKGRQVADLHYVRIRYQPNLTIITPNEELTKNAAWLKCKHRGKVSLADCYAAATASMEKATLITTDTELNKMANAENITTKIIPL